MASKIFQAKKTPQNSRPKENRNLRHWGASLGLEGAPPSSKAAGFLKRSKVDQDTGASGTSSEGSGPSRLPSSSEEEPVAPSYFSTSVAALSPLPCRDVCVCAPPLSLPLPQGRELARSTADTQLAFGEWGRGECMPGQMPPWGELEAAGKGLAWHSMGVGRRCGTWGIVCQLPSLGPGQEEV